MRSLLLSFFCLVNIGFTQPTALPKGGINLGSGHRGLLITQLQDGKNCTLAFICHLIPGFPLSGGYVEGPDFQILLKDTLSPQYEKTLPDNFFQCWSSRLLYSFSKDKSFCYNTLYCIEDDHIRIYPGQAQREARKVYQLSENQIFLGAFENRHYWWVKTKPREIFFKENNHTFKYTLHKRVTEPLGIAKGDPKGDFALRAVVKPKGWYPSPRTFEWIILNFKDAKQMD